MFLEKCARYNIMILPHTPWTYDGPHRDVYDAVLLQCSVIAVQVVYLVLDLKSIVRSYMMPDRWHTHAESLSYM